MSSQCKHCNRALPAPAGGGHRTREYCDDSCRQAARRERAEAQRLRECADHVRSWGAFQPATIDYLAKWLAAGNEDGARRLAGLIREEQGSLQELQERFRAYVAMTNERLETLTGELAARWQEQERAAGNRDAAAQPLYMDEALLKIGRALDWPRLDFQGYGTRRTFSGQEVPAGPRHINAGELHWTNFSLRGDCCEVRQALDAARARLQEKQEQERRRAGLSRLQPG